MELMSIVMLILIAGIAYAAISYRKKQEQQLDQYVDKALELYKKLIIMLRVELKDEMYYCYNNETGDFVCQGKSIEEITEAFKERYPNHGSYILNKYLHLFPGEQTKADMVDDFSTDAIKQSLREEINEYAKAKNLVK